MEGLGINLFYLIAQIFNLLVLLFLLHRFFYKHAHATLEERRSKIEQGLEHAELALKRASEAEEHYERELEKAEVEAQEIISRAIEEAEKVKTEILAGVKRESDQVLREADQQIGHERDRMMSELHRQAADLAVLTATRILGRSLDEETHRRLIRESLEELIGDTHGDEGESD